jgi:hypothetical protein
LIQSSEDYDIEVKLVVNKSILLIIDKIEKYYMKGNMTKFINSEELKIIENLKEREEKNDDKITIEKEQSENFEKEQIEKYFSQTKEAFEYYLDVFENMTFLLSYYCSSKIIDNNSKTEFFKFLFKYLNDYSILFLKSNEMKRKNIEFLKRNLFTKSSKQKYDLISSYTESWRLLLGTALLHTPLPSIVSNIYSQKCFTKLSGIYDSESKEEYSDDEEDEKDKIVESDEKIEGIFDDNGEIEWSKKDLSDNSVQTILGGTLKQLTLKLFENFKGSQIPYHKIFFLTYLSFTTPIKVLRKMKKIFYELTNNENNKDKDLNIMYMIKNLTYWIKTHYEDLDEYFISELMSFIDQNKILSKINNSEAIIKPLRTILIKKLLEAEISIQIHKADDKTSVKLSSKYVSLISKNEYTIPEFVVFDWDSEEIAKQITLIDFKLFKNVHQKELFGKNWSLSDKKLKMEKAKYITLLSDRFNDVSYWVVTEILKCEDINVRAKAISYFLEVANYLYKISNFHGLNSIVSACQSDSIFRLKKTWALVKEEDRNTLKSYSELLQHPYTNLMKKLEQTPPPCIPFM